MKHSLKIGFSFGLTSAIITTLGLMVGLYSSTNSKLAVIGGIIIIAVADALSDAMGIHVSEESENKHTTKEIWESTISTFFSKFIFASSFIIPILLFSLPIAVVIGIIWGLLLLSLFSYYLAKKKKTSWKIILEHLLIAITVIIITYFVGELVAGIFG